VFARSPRRPAARPGSRSPPPSGTTQGSSRSGVSRPPPRRPDETWAPAHQPRDQPVPSPARRRPSDARRHRLHARPPTRLRAVAKVPPRPLPPLAWPRGARHSATTRRGSAERPRGRLRAAAVTQPPVRATRSPRRGFLTRARRPREPPLRRAPARQPGPSRPQGRPALAAGCPRPAPRSSRPAAARGQGRPAAPVRAPEPPAFSPAGRRVGRDTPAGRMRPGRRDAHRDRRPPGRRWGRSCRPRHPRRPSWTMRR
jgi:hypothetical protein